MKNKIAIISAIIVVLAGVFFLSNLSNNEKNMENEPNKVSGKVEKNQVVTLKTSMGDISIELYMDKMPITAGNFLKLVNEGFYNGTKFHRVIDNFMIQGGDPNTKGENTSIYGQGGPGYTIEDEFIQGFSNIRGTISMANTGQQNSGGSQFFINHSDNTGLDFDKEPLSSKHPVFGEVIEGMDIVDKIVKVEVGVGDLPIEPIIINEVITSSK